MINRPEWLALGINVRAIVECEQRLACPRCAKHERDDSLGVNVCTGTFHCFRCGWKGNASRPDNAHCAPRVTRLNDPLIVARKRERLRQTWHGTVSLTHPSARPVRRYLEARALADVLSNPPATLRAHPGIAYWEGTAELGRYPAMVALFHGAEGHPVTLHVTYLRADGCAKASVPAPKKILGVPLHGATRGGAIHLYEPRGGILGVAEGIESALALHLLHRIPVWSAFCADNLRTVRLPENLHTLLIAVDIDVNGKGEEVAQALANRVMRWRRAPKVFFVKPEGAGACDLNDELRRGVS